MSTVKISELALISQLNANTSNTLFVAVDVPTGITGKFTGKTLAQGLYSNEVLNVGTNPVTYPGVVAQFSGNSTPTTTYLQVNFQNFTSNGSTDFVASTSDSTNANSFIDMGISGKDYSDPTYYSAFKPYDGYVYVGGPTATSYSGNLILGTASTKANIVFMVGGTMTENVVGYITNNGYNLLSNVSVKGALSTTTGLKFADGSTQNTASNPAAFSQASYTQANTATTIGQAAFAKANNALANTSGTFAGNLTITGNLIISNTATINGTLIPTLTANGNVSAYASKHLVEYNPTTKALTYSSTPDASSPYITGYSQEIHVSPVAFNDSGKGTIGDPVKTIARAIELITPAFETTGAGQRKTIILHPGDYPENVTINTQYTVLTTHELIGKSTTLSGTLTLATGCTVDGLKMNNLVISGTSANGSIDLIGCTVTTAVTKTSSAYTNFRGCDLSSSTLSITGTGTVVMVGGNYFTVTVNNAAAAVLAKAVVSMGPVTLTAGTMQISDTLVYSATNTSNAITQSAGSVLTLNNSQTLIPDLSNVARNSFGGFYSILHSVYDKPNSTFGGTSLNAISYSQYINADNLNVQGNATITGTVTPTKGFIYTPTQYPGAQTAITIDFANNSVIRANTSTGCTVSFVNYTSGKEVVLWLTNTAGTNQTFTHGVNALNSTVNSTTYNIPGTSTIVARYFSFGNDLANTFVAVVHA